MNSALVVADCSFVGLFDLGTNLGDFMPTRVCASFVLALFNVGIP